MLGYKASLSTLETNGLKLNILSEPKKIKLETSNSSILLHVPSNIYKSINFLGYRVMKTLHGKPENIFK
jgi:hypothetical protein